MYSLRALKPEPAPPAIQAPPEVAEVDLVLTLGSAGYGLVLETILAAKTKALPKPTTPGGVVGREVVTAAPASEAEPASVLSVAAPINQPTASVAGAGIAAARLINSKTIDGEAEESPMDSRADDVGISGSASQDGHQCPASESNRCAVVVTQVDVNSPNAHSIKRGDELLVVNGVTIKGRQTTNTLPCPMYCLHLD